MSLVCGEIFDLATHHFCDKAIHGSVRLFVLFLFIAVFRWLKFLCLISAQNYNLTKTNDA